MHREVRVEQDFWTTGRSESGSDRASRSGERAGWHGDDPAAEAEPPADTPAAASSPPDGRNRPLVEALEIARNRPVDDSPPRTSRTSGDSVVIDLRLAENEVVAAPEGSVAHDSGRTQPDAAIEAGDLWRQSVQGWVKGPDGNPEWRPIVTTTTDVANWTVDVNLGMVTGESACPVDSDGLGSLIASERGKAALRHVLAKDRKLAEDAMVQEAVARGAHAVIGVKLDYTFLGECLIVTATGTAVTLRAQP